MRKVSQRQFIQKMLDSMFSTIKHSNQAEREVCALQTFVACKPMKSKLSDNSIIVITTIATDTGQVYSRYTGVTCIPVAVYRSGRAELHEIQWYSVLPW